MGRNCKECKKFFTCKVNKESFPIPYGGCMFFESVKKHNYVLIHKRIDLGFYFIVAFGNDFMQMIELRNNQPDYGKNNHDYFVVSNSSTADIANVINHLKDECLLRICENVAFTLSRAEYSILKKKYLRSKHCFDIVKSKIVDACYILDNY